MDAPLGTVPAAHLLRRVGFGGSRSEIARVAASSMAEAVGEVVEGLRAPGDAAADAVAPPAFATAETLRGPRESTVEQRQAAQRAARSARQALVLWWLERMVVADHPVREKLTLLWHGHFATSLQKVRLPELMFRHQRMLSAHAAGRFDALVAAVARDPAMLLWLDGRDNRAGAPNENFARELFELFTLGHGGGHAHGDADGGGPPYTELDVAEAARALTGWQIDPTTGNGVLRPRRFDAGTKTILGETGTFGLDDVVRIVTTRPTSAPFVVAKLWSRIARPAAPDDPVVRELAGPFADDLDIAGLLRRMLVHPAFTAPATRTALLKTPVEWLVGAARTLGLHAEPWWLPTLAGLGQVPLAPPDVAGWPENEGWLSTSSAHVRLQAASRLAAAAGTTDVDGPDDLAALLGVERWSSGTAAALQLAGDDATELLTIALSSPEYLVA